jgi:hypothetical protein
MPLDFQSHKRGIDLPQVFEICSQSSEDQCPLCLSISARIPRFLLKASKHTSPNHHNRLVYDVEISSSVTIRCQCFGVDCAPDLEDWKAKDDEPRVQTKGISAKKGELRWVALVIQNAPTCGGIDGTDKRRIWACPCNR